jgi:branched-chain amino acid transport system ATP-binding protein
LSGGEQQMLVIGRALMFNPKMLALDELSLGLAPLVVRDITECLHDISSEQDISILLVEQNAEMALNFVVYGYVIENGRIVLNESSEKLRDNEDVKEFYLGMSVGDKKRDFSDIKYYKKKKRWLV